MTDTVSPGLQLLLMADGLHDNDWGDQANANWQKIESGICGKTALTVSGGSRTLTDDEARAAMLNVTGALGSDQTLVIPARAKLYVVNAAITGGKLIIETPASGSAVATLKSGVLQQVFCDGTNVYLVNLPPKQSGIMEMFGGETIPDNYILCDGRSVSRADYADLFAAIGTKWGTGDGSTTFNVPDMRGRVPAAPDAMGGSAANRITHYPATLGATTGEEVHTLGLTEVPAHSHSLSDPGHAHTVTDPGHSHTYTKPVSGLILTGSVGVNLDVYESGTNTGSATTGVSVDSHVTGISMGSVGGSGSHNNMQPTLFVNFIIHI